MAGTRIAVIGMGLNYPGATSLKKFWENVLAQRIQFRQLLDSRLPLSEYHGTPEEKDKTYGSQAAYIDDFNFDWQNKRVPKSTFESTDIVHWLTLDCVQKAIDDAGLSFSDELRLKTGVIIGNTLTGENTRSLSMRLRWPFVRKLVRESLEANLPGLGGNDLQKLLGEMESSFKSVFPDMTEDTLAGGLANTIAGRVCNYFDLKGGGYVVDGACSSSLISIYTACDALENGKLDLAIAGGVDISLDTFELVGFARAGALTRDIMAVYDKKARGFIPGEGCGIVILKRMDDAIRDGDVVYATVAGWGISSDGKGGITAPSDIGQSIALRRAYDQAGYGISSVDFFEGHGTGTKLGDVMEIRGIVEAFDDKTPQKKYGVTSLKSLIGHTKAAAGVGALIKTILAVNQRIIPPTANCDDPHALFSDQANFLFPVMEGIEIREGNRLRAGVSAMGFGGINCHVTVESCEKVSKRFVSELAPSQLLFSKQRKELFFVSAGNYTSLIQRLRMLFEEATVLAQCELADIAKFLSDQSTVQDPVRIAFTASNNSELKEKIDLLLNRQNELSLKGSWDDQARGIRYQSLRQEKKIVFCFSGQGSQYLAMAKTLLKRHPWAAKMLSACDEIMLRETGESFSWIFNATGNDLSNEDFRRQNTERLNRTEFCQPAIAFCSALWAEHLKRINIEAVAVCGHSLGELTALYYAGAYDLETLISLAAFRGRLMASKSERTGAMVSVQCSSDEAARRLDGLIDCYIANVNTASQTIISLAKEAVEKVSERFNVDGIAVKLLPVSNAFHSPFVGDAAHGIKDFRFPQRAAALKIPFISGIDAEVHASIDLPGYLSKQIISPVNFIDLCSKIPSLGNAAVEVGPGGVLKGILAANVPNFPVFNCESRNGDASDVLDLVGYALASGDNVLLGRIYQDRLIRPYRPFADKIFIANHLEKKRPAQARALAVELKSIDLSAGGEALKTKASGMPESQSRGQAARDSEADKKKPTLREQVERSISERISEITGFDAKSVQAHYRLGDDLNLDSIKVMELLASLAKRHQAPDLARLQNAASLTVGSLADACCQAASAVPAAKDDAVSTVNLSGSILSDLKHRIAEISGFSPEQIRANYKMTSDLNLDSIKSAEILSFIRKKYNVISLPETDFVNQDLQGLADVIAKSLESKTQAAWDAAKGIIVSLTGISENQITPDKRLEADLNFTGKMPEKFAMQLAERLGVKGNIELDALKNQTLEKITRIFSQKAGEGVPNDPNRLQRPANQPKWVRIFKKAYRPCTTKTVPFVRAVDDTKKNECLIVGSSPFAKTFHDFLKSSGAQVSFKSDKAYEPGKFTHVYYFVDPDKYDWSGKDSLADFINEVYDSVVRTTADIKFSRYQTVSIVMDTFKRNPGFAPRMNAFLNSMHLERSDIRTRCFNINSARFHNHDGLESSRLILEHTNSPEKHKNIFFADDGKVSEQFLEPVFRFQLDQRPNQITDDDVLVVFGGGKGITAECAFQFAKQKRCKTILVGSSPLGREKDTGSSEIHHNIGRYRQAGLAAFYHQCDVLDQAQVDSLLSGIEKEHGKVSAVVFGVGANRISLVHQVLPEDAAREVAPKVIGLKNVLRWCDAKPVKVIGTMTSIIGVTGMPGNAWYAFSNETATAMMEEYRLKNPGTHLVAFAYSVWDEVGMGARMGSNASLAKKGILSIPPAEGAQRFCELLTGSPASEDIEYVITANIAGLDTWRMNDYAPGEKSRFDGRVVNFVDGVSLELEIELSTEQDLYLQDHDYKGSLLMPTVFGAEAMMFAANSLLRRYIDGKLAFRKMNLPRPITVPKGGRRQIRVTAMLNDPSVKADLTAQVDMTCEIDEFSEIRFQAEVFAGAEMHGLHPPGGIRTAVADGQQRQADVFYGPILFQGPRFRRIKSVFAAEKSEPGKGYCVFESLYEQQASVMRSAYKGGQEFNIHFLDPFFLDSLLQSVQLIIPKDQCLPISIGEISYERIPEPGLHKAIALLKDKSDRDYTADIFVVDGEGQVIVRLIDYRVRWLETVDANPEARHLLSHDFSKAGGEKPVAKAIHAMTGPAAPESVTVAAEEAHSGEISGSKDKVFMLERNMQFADYLTVRRKLLPSKYFEWMGDIREKSTAKINEYLRGRFEKGEWGLVTNNAEVEVLGGVDFKNKRIRSRIWLESMMGKHGSTLNLRFDWATTEKGEILELLATGSMQATWVRITGHGTVEVEPFPGTLAEHFQGILIQGAVAPQAEGAQVPFRFLSQGRTLYSSEDFPTKLDPAFECVFDTSLVHSNLVGNVYFSNYAKWIVHTRDKMFNSSIDGMHRIDSYRGELLTSGLKIHHLSESMPFDEVKVAMKVTKVIQDEVHLYYEIYRNHAGGAAEKLAYAVEILHWAVMGDSSVSIVDFPADVLSLLLGKARRRKDAA